MTHIKHFIDHMATTKNTVIKALGITEEWYEKHLHDVAVDWLLDHLNKDTLATLEVLESPLFLKWWSVHVYHRNNNWLASTNKIATETQRLLNDWLYYHSAARLLDPTIKDAELLYNGYANIKWH